MHDLDRNEDRLRGTYDFPFEFHHIESNHPRYVMSYHWHVEYEIIRILKGSLTVTLNEKSFIAMPGDIIFVHSGILHSGIPDDCVYQCIVFDGNFFLKNNSACAGYIQKILHQEIMIYHHFSPKHPDICDVVNSLFDALWKKPVGYEMTVIGQFYHFFGLVFGNHTILKVSHVQGGITRESCSSNRSWISSNTTMLLRLLCNSFLLLCRCRQSISAGSFRK